MTTLPKYAISTLVSLLFAICLYFLYQSIETSQSEHTTSTNTGVSQTSSSAIETDSGKRLTTYSESGSNWGMSPFGSGKPLEEEKKLEFKKPNTEWKTRTLSGITYVFGEGNPKEVALPESEMKGCSWQDGGDYCTDSGAGYVDPLLEKLIYDVLNSPDWQVLLWNCEKDFRILDSSMQDSQPFVNHISYDTLIHLGQFISLEEIFIINSQTGRKNITREGYNKLMTLYNYIQRSSDAFNNGGLGVPLPGITKCVDTYGVNIANKLINIRWMPWRGRKDILESQGGWDGKFIPLNQSF